MQLLLQSNTLVILILFGNKLKNEPKFTGMLWMYSVRIELPTSFFMVKTCNSRCTSNLSKYLEKYVSTCYSRRFKNKHFPVIFQIQKHYSYIIEETF